MASGCREPASRRTDGAPIVRGMSRRIHLQKCGTRVPTRSGQINRLVVQWTGAAHRASSMGEIPFTTATGGMGDNASTVATQYGPVNSFRIRRDPGAVRARHFPERSPIGQVHGHVQPRSLSGHGHLHPIGRHNLRPLHVLGRCSKQHHRPTTQSVQHCEYLLERHSRVGLYIHSPRTQLT